MLTVEEIKKIFDNFVVEGFEWDDKRIVFKKENYVWFETSLLTCDMWIDVYYPLFLQRVIEGVNKKNHLKGYNIAQDWNGIRVFNRQGFRAENIGNYKLKDCNNLDQAKEQAIKYVLGQME